MKTTVYELEGWGSSTRHPNRRGGCWSVYTFKTLSEARREKSKQERDQTWKRKQKEVAEKIIGHKAAQYRWGDDLNRIFEIVKVTREKVDV